MSTVETVVALLVGVAIAVVIVREIRGFASVEPAVAVTQPLNQSQILLSATEARRLSDRQQLNKFFLQNWRDRPTKPNLD
jgi:hypothetical protein